MDAERSDLEKRREHKTFFMDHDSITDIDPPTDWNCHPTTKDPPQREGIEVSWGGEGQGIHLTDPLTPWLNRKRKRKSVHGIPILEESKELGKKWKRTKRLGHYFHYPQSRSNGSWGDLLSWSRCPDCRWSEDERRTGRIWTESIDLSMCMEKVNKREGDQRENKKITALYLKCK